MLGMPTVVKSMLLQGTPHVLRSEEDVFYGLDAHHHVALSTLSVEPVEADPQRLRSDPPRMRGREGEHEGMEPHGLPEVDSEYGARLMTAGAAATTEHAVQMGGQEKEGKAAEEMDDPARLAEPVSAPLDGQQIGGGDARPKVGDDEKEDEMEDEKEEWEEERVGKEEREVAQVSGTKPLPTASEPEGDPGLDLQNAGVQVQPPTAPQGGDEVDAVRDNLEMEVKANGPVGLAALASPRPLSAELLARCTGGIEDNEGEEEEEDDSSGKVVEAAQAAGVEQQPHREAVARMEPAVEEVADADADADVAHVEERGSSLGRGPEQQRTGDDQNAAGAIAAPLLLTRAPALEPTPPIVAYQRAPVPQAGAVTTFVPRKLKATYATRQVSGAGCAPRGQSPCYRPRCFCRRPPLNSLADCLRARPHDWARALAEEMPPRKRRRGGAGTG